jgi:predicted small integral membrane protein
VRFARAADFRYGTAIYGTIVATALIGALLPQDVPARAMTVSPLATSVVLWVAHAWSEAVGERVAGRERRRDFVRYATAEWPLVQAGFLPAGFLALAWIGVLSRDTGAKLALAAAFAQLAAWGVVAGRRSHARWSLALAAGAVDLALGGVIVTLEIAIH